jgi:CheY-like chemotaxis protein
MLGIPVATVRNWEERYGAIVPERSAGGHRLYSRDQTEQLRFVATEVARGLSAADAHRLLAERRQGARIARPSVPGGGTRPRVLVAERDHAAAELEKFVLRADGHEVIVALTAREAEERWLEHRPQLAIVDLMLAGGQGAELCRRLKALHDGAVLAVSVLPAGDEALTAGADAFLQKPLDPFALAATVEELGATARGGAE